MGRILYIVGQEHSLLSGYLKAKVDARSPEGHIVEIKIDERRGERRQQSQGRDPERREGERRRHPDLVPELRARGYVTLVQEDDSQPPEGVVGAEPALGWRPRSTRGQRAARAWRRQGPRWALRAIVLLAAVGLLIILARSIHLPANPSPGADGSGARAPATRVQEASRTPSAPPTEAAPPSQELAPRSPETAMRAGPSRASGVVLSVDVKARTLVLNDLGAATEARRLRVALAPDARLVLSERAPEAADPSHPFKDTAIELSDIRSGDFVVVEMRGHDGDALARSVVVTLRANQGARAPKR